ncbi:MAG: helix-turn-helix domain-containing protein [Candidatus Micrarchaeota archaeon]|nr:helix-turn-helix domain-containing protein [Candidatus Micrarchaeota archaeon]
MAGKLLWPPDFHACRAFAFWLSAGKEKENEVRNVRREYERLPGRPKKLTPEEISMAVELYYKEGMPVREVAYAMRVSHMTVWRAIAKAGLPEMPGRFPLDQR